jgi:DNA-binding NarL/FixJ family response regulator
MPSSISLLIVHSKELIRAGLRAMLANSGIKIVGEATTADNAASLAKKHQPDVLLLDSALPGGDAFDLLKKIGKSVPATKFVLLSALENPTYVARAKASGASDFLLESVSGKELVKAIENAVSGKSAQATGLFGNVAASMAAREKRSTREPRITPREEQVLRHVALGLSNDEIARSLGISVETVKEHVQNLLWKLSVKDRTQAAVWAVRAKLV